VQKHGLANLPGPKCLVHRAFLAKQVMIFIVTTTFAITVIPIMVDNLTCFAPGRKCPFFLPRVEIQTSSERENNISAMAIVLLFLRLTVSGRVECTY
jgi:hypothetical protein